MAAKYQHVDITPEASDFIELLRELGHLDDGAIETLTTTLMEAARPNVAVSLSDARRCAAAWFADNEARLRPEARELLNAEWSRLFS